MTNPAYISLDQVKQAAEELLKKYHPELTIPVPIEEIVELKLKIKIILIQGLIKNFGVNAFIANTFDSIVIDENMFQRQPERIRFTVAEEIGHLFLHKDWYIKNGPNSFSEYLDWQLKLDKTLFNYIERQAKIQPKIQPAGPMQYFRFTGYPAGIRSKIFCKRSMLDHKIELFKITKTSRRLLEKKIKFQYDRITFRRVIYSTTF